jgi:hypothetical protein
LIISGPGSVKPPHWMRHSHVRWTERWSGSYCQMPVAIEASIRRLTGSRQAPLSCGRAWRGSHLLGLNCRTLRVSIGAQSGARVPRCGCNTLRISSRQTGHSHGAVGPSPRLRTVRRDPDCWVRWSDLFGPCGMTLPPRESDDLATVARSTTSCTYDVTSTCSTCPGSTKRDACRETI